MMAPTFAGYRPHYGGAALLEIADIYTTSCVTNI